MSRRPTSLLWNVALKMRVGKVRTFDQRNTYTRHMLFFEPIKTWKHKFEKKYFRPKVCVCIHRLGLLQSFLATKQGGRGAGDSAAATELLNVFCFKCEIFNVNLDFKYLMLSIKWWMPNVKYLMLKVKTGDSAAVTELWNVFCQLFNVKI